MVNRQAKRRSPREMKRRQVRNPEVVRRGDHTIPDQSSLARLYLPPLTRLLGLSSDLDELLRNCKQFDWAAWKKTVVRAQCVLRMEKERLGVIDRDLQTFLLCRGGQRKLVIEANLKMRKKAAEAHDLDTARRRVGAQMAILALNRCVTFGLDMSPFNLSDEEKTVVTSYFENSTKQESQPRRSDQSESNGSSITITASGAHTAALTRLLSEVEPDVIALQHELEAVSHQLTCRIARLSGELERCYERKKEERQSRQDMVRIRVAFVLESKRAQLVGRAIAGILRCFGGQQRLLMESAWRQHEGPETWIKDPRAKKIVDRICEEVAAKGAQRDK